MHTMTNGEARAGGELGRLQAAGEALFAASWALREIQSTAHIALYQGSPSRLPGCLADLWLHGIKGDSFLNAFEAVRTELIAARPGPFILRGRRNYPRACAADVISFAFRYVAGALSDDALRGWWGSLKTAADLASRCTPLKT
jgi:hypothetical protein